jgi:MFS family permease
VSDRVGKGIRTSPRDALLAATANPAEVGRAFGFHRGMDHLGAVVGPLIAAALLWAGLELRSIFALAVIPGVLALVAVATVKEPPKTEPSRASGGTLPGALTSYLAILALFTLGNATDAFLLLRAQELGTPLAAIPLLWTLFHVSKVGSSLIGGSWSDRVPRVRLIVAGWIVYAATYAGFAFADHAWQVWALFGVYGLYHGLTEPAEKALVKDLAPEGIRGRAYGWYNFTVGICAVPSGLLTGWLWERFGAAIALGAGAALSLVSCAALLAWSVSARSSR